MTTADDVDPRVDALYELPVAEFTAARNDLVRALKAEQRRDQAAVVSKLRRPAIAAWAVNQAVRRHRERFTALLDAGAEVRRAQRRALSGVRNSGMRDAARVRRRLIDELTAAAVDVLAHHGTSGAAHRDDIAATFDAASADDEAASHVGAARLTAPLQVASGFGSVDGLTVLADEPAAKTTRAADGGALDDDTAEDARDDDTAERARIAELRRDAMRALEQARRDLAEAEATARHAADAVVARSAAADEAERAVSAAEQTLRRRQREAENLRGQVAAEERGAEQARAAIAERTARLREHEQALRDLTRASMPM